MWYFDVYIVGKTQEKMVTAARYVLFSGVKCRQNVKKIAPAAQNILFSSVSYRYQNRACILCYYSSHLP